MITVYLRFLIGHGFVAFIMLFGLYVTSHTFNDAISTWFASIPIFFGIGMIGNFICFIVKRKEKDNLKAFLITTPIMLIPYICSLILVYFAIQV